MSKTVLYVVSATLLLSSTLAMGPVPAFQLTTDQCHSWCKTESCHDKCEWLNFLSAENFILYGRGCKFLCDDSEGRNCHLETDENLSGQEGNISFCPEYLYGCRWSSVQENSITKWGWDCNDSPDAEASLVETKVGGAICVWDPIEIVIRCGGSDNVFQANVASAENELLETQGCTWTYDPVLEEWICLTGSFLDTKEDSTPPNCPYVDGGWVCV
eukprot:CAMPEP_0115008154 /NCGR_PEP_ID=MMETSP0216-20121206/21712_1 /TAXON_ID=223996 /ORGANISM="Protocruzia adherens, Strain Boccale" /LENGTH=214 /DNA_ID=CAMNT_0002375445 /DNA_START=26 /DNA_END=670 /DNA_ORIENTATION=+